MASQSAAAAENRKFTITEPASDLVRQLEKGVFEVRQPASMIAYEAAERRLGHLLFRKAPPSGTFLNLGCGPHIFDGWVNADIYGVKRWLLDGRYRPNWRLDFSRPWNCPDDRWDGIFTEHAIDAAPYTGALISLRECLRTLKPGGVLRVSLCDFSKFEALAPGATPIPGYVDFPHPTLAVAWATQMHGHRSVWTASLLTSVLDELGFIDIEERSFSKGADPDLLRDDPGKSRHSFYVEARKPL